MPYGVPHEHGGDTPENDARMERCIDSVMKSGHGKVAAIKICKSSLFGPKGKGSRGK